MQEYHPKYGELVAVKPDGTPVYWRQGYDENGVLCEWYTPVQDATELFESNAEFEKSTHGAKLPEWNRFASVPTNMLYGTDLNRAHNEGDDKWVKRFFNDSDNRKLRTSRGNI
jgi:hypothetical protein